MTKKRRSPRSWWRASLLGLLACTGMASLAVAADWSTSTVDDVSRSTSTSLAFGPDGNPAIGYFAIDGCQGGTCSGDVRLARWDGASWSSEPVEHASSETPVSLAFDGLGRPTLAYTAGRDALRFARLNGSHWDIESVDAGTRVLGGASLAYDGQHHATIAYRAKNGRETDLKLARHDGSAWRTEVVEPSVGARYISLAFDPGGVPAIAYSDATDGSLDILKYARWDVEGETWDREVVRAGTRGFGVFACLAFDPSGVATITQSDVADAGYSTQLLRRTGPESDPWPTTETVDSGGCVGPASLAIASDGTIYVAHEWIHGSAAEGPDEVRVKRRVGPGSFVTEYVGFGTPYIYSLDVAVGPDGLPAVTWARRPPNELVYASQLPGIPCSETEPCDDGSLCTTEVCVDGTCEFTPLDCDDGDACTADICDPLVGCVQPRPDVSCDDGDSCTVDACDPEVGCTHTWPECGLADGCCGPGCESDPDCPCAPLGDPCQTHGDCCSGWCKSVKGNKVCSL